MAMKPGRSNVLLRAFRSLMPQDEKFIERFCEHSRLIVPAAEAFRALMSGDGCAEQHAAEIGRLEDTIDLMKDTGRRMVRYGVGFTPEMQGMADCVVRAATELRDGMPLLGAIDRSVDRLNAMSVAVRRIEGEADELLDRGLRTLFASDNSPGYKLTVEKVYDLVEAVVDRCEDVVDVIDGIVVEQV